MVVPKMKAQERNGWSRLVANLLLERSLWLRRLTDPRRDIDAECGHPEILTIQDYLREFLRGDIAARVVSIWPEESWSQDPVVYETEEKQLTEFERVWEELQEEFSFYSVLYRADVLSGIGRFGIILIGTDDGLDLREPIPNLTPQGTVEEPRPSRLLYLRPLDESVVRVSSLVRDPTHPRYGLPEFYSVTFQDGAEEGSTITRQVHWSRVVHLADNRLSSDIYGVPRLQKVMNRILDLHKVVSGSGEMFWKGGFPGLSLETQPNVQGDVELDLESIRKQVEAYMNGLQRYLATVGIEAKSLAVEIADPSPHVEAQLKLIAAALGVPWRVFIGSEAAQLASEQDMRAWVRRVSRRRQEYLSPNVIRPFVRRLVMMGVLPRPERIRIWWPDLETPSEKDRAQVAEMKASAIAKYMASGGEALLPPYHFLTEVLGMDDAEAKAALEGVIRDVGPEQHEDDPD